MSTPMRFLPVLLLVTACGAADPVPTEPSPTEATQARTVKAPPPAPEFTGVVTSRRSSVIASQVQGRIEKLSIHSGQLIKAGELVAKLDETELKTKLEQAKSNEQAALMEAGSYGAQASALRQKVVAESRQAVCDGAKEIVLLGQNVDDYRDPAGKGGLAALVREVQQIPGLKRLRFLTSHPQDLEDELLEVMAASDVVCRELQLPVQSGDDTILKRMARGYQVRHYRAIVERARSLMPDIGLATDVIVGFPGESEAAFLNTRALLEEIEFDVVHLAMYSPRPGTFAATRMPDDVPAAEKLRRLNDLLALQRSIATTKTARWIGRDVEVLIEGRDELGRPYGRIRQGKRAAVLRGGDIAPGDVVQVRVLQATAGQLTGVCPTNSEASP